MGFGGGGFGGMHIGIGGALLLGILSLVFHTDLLGPFLGGGGGPSTAVSRPENPRQKAAEQPMVEFVSFVLDDVQKTWTATLPKYGARYQRAKLDLFHDVINSACGTAQSATGPFYCPEDAKVYLDLGFFQELKDRFGAPGEFAQAYVIAHELGHHVQNLLGTSDQVYRAEQRHRSDANSLS